MRIDCSLEPALRYEVLNLSCTANGFLNSLRFESKSYWIDTLLKCVQEPVQACYRFYNGKYFLIEVLLTHTIILASDVCDSIFAYCKIITSLVNIHHHTAIKNFGVMRTFKIYS